LHVAVGPGRLLGACEAHLSIHIKTSVEVYRDRDMNNYDDVTTKILSKTIALSKSEQIKTQQRGKRKEKRGLYLNSMVR
jgi:hypothetical protein